VDTFESLIVDGAIPRKRLRHSVALIAVSGNDYTSVHQGADGDIHDLIRNVTSGIVANVQRLQEMGVAKVLVNNLPPMGCSPLRTTTNSFARCDHRGNHYAKTHNDDLKKLLREMDDVHIIDLNTAFTNIVNPTNGTV
jgi:phospholipase/lecithinase/hemolysin